MRDERASSREESCNYMSLKHAQGARHRWQHVTMQAIMVILITVAADHPEDQQVMNKMNAAVQKLTNVNPCQKDAERMNVRFCRRATLSEAFDDDEDEADAVVDQVLAEVGLNTTKDLHARADGARCPSQQAARPTTRTSC